MVLAYEVQILYLGAHIRLLLARPARQLCVCTGSWLVCAHRKQTKDKVPETKDKAPEPTDSLVAALRLFARCAKLKDEHSCYYYFGKSLHITHLHFALLCWVTSCAYHVSVGGSAWEQA